MNNVRVPGASRPMTTAEKYYAFLDRTWPTHPMMAADLDRCFPVEWVEDRWRAFCARRIYTRLMPTGDLTIVDGGTARFDFSGKVTPTDRWPDEVVREADTARQLERVIGCLYLASPSEGVSRLVVGGHHSVLDGRGGVEELQRFVRFLDGQDVQTQDQISLTPSSGSRFAWETDRSVLLDVLGKMRARNEELGELHPLDWPVGDSTRRSRLAEVPFDTHESSALVTRARAEGARPFATVAGACLLAVARAVSAVERGTFQLNVPADRGARATGRDVPPAMNVGVVSRRYTVAVDDRWELVREIASTVRAALEHGEAELFFFLSRLENVKDLSSGVDRVARAIVAAPPAVSVTNVGVFDHESDPAWLRRLWTYLAPTPNQVISYSCLSYRGRVSSTLWTDDLRVTPGRAESLVDEYRGLLL